MFEEAPRWLCKKICRLHEEIITLENGGLAAKIEGRTAKDWTAHGI